MPNVIDNTKSILGRLLATENIRIEHLKVKTASFNVKDRVLTLPIWKEMSPELYDLLIGHEVGHALYTPVDGWMEDVQKYGENFKFFLNLVEDARIEKKIKRTFPGLRKPMYDGYTQLVDREFFSVSWKDMNTLPLADRINVYFKLGVRSNITFSEKEQNIVDRIEAAETFREVMKLARELYDMAGDEHKLLEDMLGEKPESLKNEDVENLIDALDSADGSDGEYSDEYSPNPRDADIIPNAIKKLRERGDDDLADRLEKASERAVQKLKEYANREVTSLTQEAFAENEEKLIDLTAYPNIYVQFPDLDLKDWVVPHTTVHGELVFNESLEPKRDEIYSTFMTTNSRYVSYLVKEFELRRNAKQFAKARISKTGDLDMKKIWKYKLSENLFLQSTVVPDGKNHGMIMVVDMSASMDQTMAATLEQLVSLVMFCRKANIPFDVYGFNDNGAHSLDFPNCKNIWLRNDTTKQALFIDNDAFRLKQLFHHSMKASQFKRAIENILMLAYTFSYDNRYQYRNTYGAVSVRVPRGMELGSTPLNESILVLRHIAQKFKEETKVEILNTIILTDGDASGSLSFYNKTENKTNMVGESLTNTVLEDPDTKFQTHLGRYYSNRQTYPLLDMYKQITGSRVIGIYIASGRNIKNEIMRKARDSGNTDFFELENQFKKQFAKHKFFALQTKQGYDMFYVVSSKEMQLENTTMNDVMTTTHTTKPKTLLSAFKKMQNNKMSSRVFINQFILNVA